MVSKNRERSIGCTVRKITLRADSLVFCCPRDFSCSYEWTCATASKLPVWKKMQHNKF
jgi:hypothetical protein